MIVSGSLGSMQKESMLQNRLNISRKKLPSHLAVSTKRVIQSNSIYCCKKFQTRIQTVNWYLSYVTRKLLNHFTLRIIVSNIFMQIMLLDLAISVSNLPTKLDSSYDLPSNSAMSRYLKVMEQDVKAGIMKKQLGKWLLEDRAKDKDFSYRLTGKDSRIILHGFMYSHESNSG